MFENRPKCTNLGYGTSCIAATPGTMRSSAAPQAHDFVPLSGQPCINGQPIWKEIHEYNYSLVRRVASQSP